MKSSVLEGGEGLFEMPDNLPPPVLHSVSNVGFVGIMNSPPSVETIQFMPMNDEGGPMMPGGLQGVQDPVSITSQQANFTHTFLKSMLTSIDSKDPAVANAWLETLLDVIDLLPKEVVREEILGLAVSKGQSPQNSSRLAACKLIGKISTKFEPHILKSEIVGIVQCLCQDVCGEVRGSICMQLGVIARGVGLNTTKSIILPELVDLCSDEEVNVRLAGINAVVQMLPLVDQETRTDTLVPLVKKICERAFRVEDATLPVTAHLLGRICHGLQDDFSDDQKEFFLNFYCTLSKLGLPDAKKSDMGLPMPDLVVEVRSGEYEAECRQQCAYNLPAMILFAGGPIGYRKYLHDTLLSFITDPSFPVRNTLALSFHQLCTLIGNEVGILRESFLNLLRSENLEVIAALVPNISHILAAFNHHQILTQSSQQMEVLELVGALKQGEESVSKSSNWRVHSEILRQIAALALCLPPDLLFSEVVPLMIHRMHNSRPIPCRQAAARTLLVFLRHMDSKEQRNHICNTLIIEFSEANSCHKRMLFLNICRMALDLLPRVSFKNHLFKPMLALHTDPVPNIRLKVVSLLPLIKEILTLPDDRQRLQDIETAVGSLLLKENDRDVSSTVGVVISQLDKIEVNESKRGSPEGQEVPGGLKEPFGDRRVKERDKPNETNSGKKPQSSLGSKKVGITSPGTLLSARRNNVPGRIPAYVAAERRRSNTFAPELPPDENAVNRISALDPSADEFLVDAGVRIDEAAIRSRIPPPGSHQHQGVHPHQRSRVAAASTAFGNRLSRGARIPPSNVSSKIPVVGRGENLVGGGQGINQVPPQGGEVKTRQRMSPRPTARPISGVAAPHGGGTRGNIGGTRGKSLSHENLRSSSSRMGGSTSSSQSSSSAKTSPVSSRPSSPGGGGSLPYMANTAGGSSSRMRHQQPPQQQPHSNMGGGSRRRSGGTVRPVEGCSSFPGGGGGKGGGRGGGGNSTASSPSSSRCASPPGGDEPPRLQRRSAGGVVRQPRHQQQNNNSASAISVRGRGAGSKLPLPTNKK